MNRYSQAIRLIKSDFNRYHSLSRDCREMPKKFSTFLTS